MYQASARTRLVCCSVQFRFGWDLSVLHALCFRRPESPHPPNPYPYHHRRKKDHGSRRREDKTNTEKNELKHTRSVCCVYNLYRKQQNPRTDARNRRHGILFLTSARPHHSKNKDTHTCEPAQTHTHTQVWQIHGTFTTCTRTLHADASPAQFGGKLHSFDNVQLIIAQHQPQQKSGDSHTHTHTHVHPLSHIRLQTHAQTGGNTVANDDDAPADDGGSATATAAAQKVRRLSVHDVCVCVWVGGVYWQ